MQYRIAIIIPCYNEAHRLNLDAFIELFYLQPNWKFYFINDGSTDSTDNMLSTLYKQQPAQVVVINLKKNRGKGEAIRLGMIHALKESFEFIGYYDADLATPIGEINRIATLLNKNIAGVFGSRIKKIDTVIKRSFFRHIIGRIIATLIDTRFQLGIYDTQCGAKFFNASLLNLVIQEPFVTSWFFDVEIFIRLKKISDGLMFLEEPLLFWKDAKHSKLNILSFPQVCKELASLIRSY